ncbi:hypothetical protein ACAW63_24275 [Pseudomonas sp. QE6]|uniref:hypothetical protein n=1 Tax=Pseudomonas sp. QE6 TaxID=3242491 RepID=UPI00352792CC
MVFILEHRLQPALRIFAPEQKGKTTFLQQDFIPLARQHGFLVAEADLLTDPDSPERAIATALQEAVHDEQSRRPHLVLLRGLGLIVRRAKAILSACRGRSPFASGESCDIKALLEQFRQAGKGRALLVIEAAEHLTTRSAFERFTAKFRALLQAPVSGVQVVFTGASQRGQAYLFRRHDAPFYQYGFEMDFPSLGMEFACHLGDRFEETTGKEWDVDLAYRLFVMHGEMPGFLRSLYAISLSRDIGVEEAADIVLAVHPNS